jgi:hypothetical protein
MRTPLPTILRESLCADGDGTYECSFWDFPEGTSKTAARQVVAARCRELGIKPIPGKWRIGRSSQMSFDLEVMVCHRGHCGTRANPMRAGTGDLHTLYRWALVRAGASPEAVAKMGAVALEDALDTVPGYPANKTIADLMPAPLKKAFRKVATKKAWREMLTWEASCAVGFACGLRIDYAKAHPHDDPTWEYTASDMLTFAFS